MSVTINKEAMTAEQRPYPMRENLAQLVTEVSRMNPLLDFMCDTHCTAKDWNRDSGGYDNFI